MSAFATLPAVRTPVMPATSTNNGLSWSLKMAETLAASTAIVETKASVPFAEKYDDYDQWAWTKLTQSEKNHIIGLSEKLGAKTPLSKIREHLNATLEQEVPTFNEIHSQQRKKLLFEHLASGLLGGLAGSVFANMLSGTAPALSLSLLSRISFFAFTTPIEQGLPRREVNAKLEAVAASTVYPLLSGQIAAQLLQHWHIQGASNQDTFLAGAAGLAVTTSLSAAYALLRAPVLARSLHKDLQEAHSLDQAIKTKLERLAGLEYYFENPKAYDAFLTQNIEELKTHKKQLEAKVETLRKQIEANGKKLANLETNPLDIEVLQKDAVKRLNTQTASQEALLKIITEERLPNTTANLEEWTARRTNFNTDVLNPWNKLQQDLARYKELVQDTDAQKAAEDAIKADLEKLSEVMGKLMSESLSDVENTIAAAVSAEIEVEKIAPEES